MLEDLGYTLNKRREAKSNKEVPRQLFFMQLGNSLLKLQLFQWRLVLALFCRVCSYSISKLTKLTLLDSLQKEFA